MTTKTSNKSLDISNTRQILDKLPGISYSNNMLMNVGQLIHNQILSLNNSKYFAGIVMILLNVGSKFVSISFSRSVEEYLKGLLSKQILVFAMAWMGTRDIYTATGLTLFFTIFSEYVFNEDSKLCIIPERYKVLNKPKPLDPTDHITDTEINGAIISLEKARKLNKEHKMLKEESPNMNMNIGAMNQ